MLQLREALSENQINTKGRRTKRGKDSFLMTCLKHLEPAVPEENSKTGLHNKSQQIRVFYISQSAFEFCYLQLKEGSKVNLITEMWILLLNIVKVVLLLTVKKLLNIIKYTLVVHKYH